MLGGVTVTAETAQCGAGSATSQRRRRAACHVTVVIVVTPRCVTHRHAQKRAVTGVLATVLRRRVMVAVAFVAAVAARGATGGHCRRPKSWLPQVTVFGAVARLRARGRTHLHRLKQRGDGDFA